MKQVSQTRDDNATEARDSLSRTASSKVLLPCPIQNPEAKTKLPMIAGFLRPLFYLVSPRTWKGTGSILFS
jgi:hypothetical protein